MTSPEGSVVWEGSGAGMEAARGVGVAGVGGSVGVAGVGGSVACASGTAGLLGLSGNREGPKRVRLFSEPSARASASAGGVVVGTCPRRALPMKPVTVGRGALGRVGRVGRAPFPRPLSLAPLVDSLRPDLLRLALAP